MYFYISESDDDVSSEKLPQVGFYCHKFNKKREIKSKVKSSSIKPLKKDAAYVPLRCNKDGNFTLFNEGTGATETVDVTKVSCTKRGQYPALKKHTNETNLCSRVGADGRTDDLQDYVHYVEIGWNMSAMAISPSHQIAPTDLKDMVHLIRNNVNKNLLVIHLAIFILRWHFHTNIFFNFFRYNFALMKKYMERFGQGILFGEIPFRFKTKEDHAQVSRRTTPVKKTFLMDYLLER